MPDELERVRGLGQLRNGGSEWDARTLASEVAEGLRKRHWSVVKCDGSYVSRDAVGQLADENGHRFKQPRRELKDAFLGRNPSGKAWFLKPEEAAKPSIDHYLSQVHWVHSLLGHLDPNELGFRVMEEKLGLLLRAPLAGKFEAQKLESGAITNEDVASGILEDQIRFMKTRRLCMIYVLSGEASVELFPREGDGMFDDATLSLEEDDLLIFDTRVMGYECKLTGDEPFALQTWVGELLDVQSLQVEHIRAAKNTEDLVMPPPLDPCGIRTLVTSIATRLPGCENVGEAYCAMMGLMDGYRKIPQNRFDLDVYYSEAGDLGTSRTMHSGLVDDSIFNSFDCDFFGFAFEDAEELGIQIRTSIEVGYDCFIRAGLGRKDIRGQKVSIYVGDSGRPSATRGWSCASLLTHWLGTSGPMSVIDTACSAAMVSFCMAHQDVCLGRSVGAMAGGVNALDDAMPYIAMSSGRMISSRGRSRTFDNSADGYGRGEGMCAIFLEPEGNSSPMRKKCGRPPKYELGQIASTQMNQDGRSASITAPSGPSQTACINQAIREAKISPAEVSMGECHGTGTSLGDPIEVGSSRMVMDKVTRDEPYTMNSAKTNFGHLELGAGTVGLVKAILVSNHGYSLATNFLYQENEHFAIKGFPLIMPTEAFAFPRESVHVGVSSFGFGGTNARAQIWTDKKIFQSDGIDMVPVPKEPVIYSTVQCPKCLGKMCWLCSMAIPDFTPLTSERHQCRVLREESDSYRVCSNCYNGDNLYGVPECQDVVNPHKTLYVVGSWSDWTELQELVMNDAGIYQFPVRLGSTLQARFSLVVDADRRLTVHPNFADADQHARIKGPDREGDGLHWLIDGHADGTPEGMMYCVQFQWGGSSWKKISWEPTEEMLPSPGYLIRHGTNAVALANGAGVVPDRGAALAILGQG